MAMDEFGNYVEDAPAIDYSDPALAPPNSTWNGSGWTTTKPDDPNYDPSWGGYVTQEELDWLKNNPGDMGRYTEATGNTGTGINWLNSVYDYQNWDKVDGTNPPGPTGPTGPTGPPRPTNNPSPSNTPTGSSPNYTSPIAPSTPSVEKTPITPPPSSSASKYESYMMDLYRQMFKQQEDAAAANKARNEQLYGMLMGRATQALDIDPNDPIIKAQTDAYSANTDRSTRNYISDMAEQLGPYGNMIGERRMANEHAGIANANFQAELLGRELTAQRAIVADALNGMQGMLSADQQIQLQKQLGLIDAAIRQQGLAQNAYGLETSRMVGVGGLDNQLMDILLRNDQFNSRLGFDATDRARYWDEYVRNGGTL